MGARQRSRTLFPRTGDLNFMKNATLAKRLASEQKMAILSTNSKRYAGFPFGSVVGYALDAEARPLLLISRLAVHYRNLEADPRASLTVFDDDALADPSNAPRLTLMGEFSLVTNDANAQAAYLARHPEAAEWIQFGDFSIMRMEVKDLFFVAGFGSMGWIMPVDFQQAVV